MKNAAMWLGALCAAAAAFMLWDTKREKPVEELAHKLEEAWSDHHTVA